MDPKSKCIYPYNIERKVDLVKIHREKGHVKMKAEVGVIWPQVKEHLEPPGAGISKKEFSSKISAQL